MPSHSELLTQINVDENMPGNPLGFYVLLEIIEVADTSNGGIYLGSQNKEQDAEECGYVRAIGPTAYYGWEGCESSTDDSRLPYQKWGLEIGDLVEFRKYEGKISAIPNYQRWRYVPDSHIVGVINQKKGPVND